MSRRLLTLATLLTVLAGAAVLPAAALAGTRAGSVVLADGRVLPPIPDGLVGPSAHAAMLDTLGRGHFDFVRGARPRVPLGGDRRSVVRGASLSTAVASLPNGLRKEVFGFLPYWMLNDAALASMNYDLTSTIAYFSVGANRDGALVKGSPSAPSTGWAGWTSSRMTNVINLAHGNGVRVVLTVSMMAWDSSSAANMAALLGSSSARTQLVNEIVAAVDDRAADGVNLDFEMVATSVRDQYTSFVRQLKAALVAAGVGSYLTVCTTAGAATWATGYDVAALTASGAADAIFVMGYDYSWSGSARAGAVAPIDSPYMLDVNQSMTDFLQETAGSKLIWGVPYYGRTWPTTSSQLNAPTTDGISHAYYYTGALSLAGQHGRLWDDVGKVPWFRYWDGAAGSWVQGYYDDAASLAMKYDLVNARGLAGTGMWTLLMDQGHNELWRVLADKFVDDSEPPVGGVSLLPEVVDATAIQVSWKAIDYASGLDTYDVQRRRVGSTAWTTWLSGTQATTAWFVGQAGTSYEFRISAVDMKGNRQPWMNVPPQPAVLTAGTFARVSATSLNVRSGPGTWYAVLTTLSEGGRVELIDGPTSGDGYSWWRVQFGFSEWPSSDYPRIGYVAAGSGGDPYIVPTRAPTISTLDPFVADLSHPASFSPNGDGAHDTLTVDYRLKSPSTATRLDVLNQAGAVVRSISLGARPSGSNSVTWDGRLAGGGWATAGRYLLRVVATDAGGASHAAPTSAFDAGLLAAAGVTADLTPPSVKSATPAGGAAMVPLSAELSVALTEPVSGVNGSSLRLTTAGGTTLPAGVTWDAVHLRATLVPTSPLPADAMLLVEVGSGIHDPAGNRLAPVSWSFHTAPGVAFAPWRRMSVLPGTSTGYQVGDQGRLLSSLSATFTSPSGASVSQRAVLPNLPGSWLYVENGIWAGRWLRESPIAFLPGQTALVTYPATTRIVVLAGTYIGYRFNSSGDVTATHTASLGATSGANVTARAIINGRAYLAVLNGIWAGYWLPESPSVHRAGMLSRRDFPALPRLAFAAGSYTGFRYDADGNVTAQLQASLPRASGASASAWAVINGRPHFLISNGIWAGYWVPEAPGVSLAVVP